ncbi:hypothetical protein EON83_10670 [bacterium]|nr:MAG: hypothetical protein EON83_10670 [bacterium]
MKITTPTTKLAFVAGILGVCGLGFLAPSASAAPRRETRRTTTTRTHTVTRTQPSQRPVVVNRNRTVVNHNRTVVVTPSRPVVVTRNRPVVVTRNRTVVTRRSTYNNRNTRNVNQNSTWNGRVTYVSGGRFGINVGGNRFTVLPSSGLPRGLSTNDYVQVSGVRNGGTIRSNRVYITRNA